LEFLDEGLDLVVCGFGEDEAGVVDVDVCEDDGGEEEDEAVEQKFVLQVEGAQLIIKTDKLSKQDLDLPHKQGPRT